MSSASSANDALTGYIAGQVPVERVVASVAEAYYREQGAGSREQLQPLMDIIERAHPGVVELAGSAVRPGFAVRLAERPFPKRHEAEFRQAVQALLVGGFADLAGPAPGSPLPAPGLLHRIYTAVRKLFTAST